MDYTELKQAIANWVDYSFDDARIPVFISLAEAKMNRLIKTLEMSCAAQATGDGERTAFDLPADWAGARQITVGEIPATYLTPSSFDLALTQLYPPQVAEPTETVSTPHGWVYTLSAASATPGAPGGIKLRVAPVVPEGVGISMDYYRRVPPLSDAAPTNWMLEDNEDVYLQGSLSFAYGSAMDERRADWYNTRFEKSLNEVHLDDWRRRAANTDTYKK